MKTIVNELLGYVERETRTYNLRTRLVVLDETAICTDGEGVVHKINAGSRLLVVDHMGVEQPLVEQLLDLVELDFHSAYGAHYPHEETRTPLDLRTPEHGGRQDKEELPF